MRIVKKTQVRDLYICEICGKNSYDRDEIEDCEASHTCLHKQTYTDYYKGDDNMDNLYVIERCLRCKKILYQYCLNAFISSIAFRKDILKLLKENDSKYGI